MIDGTTVDDAEDLGLTDFMKQQGVYGFILKMKQLILMLMLLIMIILSLLNIRLNY